MKINDIEKLLGISKANIRFYEKEGLLSPARTANGYRDYNQDDIYRLKEIILLRKLGVHIHQISGYFHGTVTLQEMLQTAVQDLQTEMVQLKGSLTLCHQLQQEGVQTLDVERYWQILQAEQSKGICFHSLAKDYIQFVDAQKQNTRELAKPMHNSPRAVLILVILGLLFAAYVFWAGGWELVQHLGFQISLQMAFPYLLGLCMIPAFFIGRKYPKFRKPVEWAIRGILVLILMILLLKTITT